MLREYRLTNFKAFGETVTIPIRPLTLIFGANSSGKSSIFQSMLLLKQTLEEAKNPNTALLPKGSLVDLGTYRDFVHRHDTERDFEFGARFDLENMHDLMQTILEHSGSKKAGISIQFSSEKKGAAVSFDQVDIAIGDERQDLISCLKRSIFERRGQGLLKSWVELVELPREKHEEADEIVINESVDFRRRCKSLADLVDWPKKKSELPKEKGEKARAIIKEIIEVIKGQDEIYHAGQVEIQIEPKREFWRHWYNGTKDYIENYDPMSEFVEALTDGVEVSDDIEEKRDDIEEKRDYLEELRKYQFEDAIKDLKTKNEALIEISYKNFLPEEFFLIDQLNNGPFYSLLSYGHGANIVKCNIEKSGWHNGTYNEIDGYDISRFVEPVCSTFRRLLEDLAYLGPLRSQPERYYTFSGDTTGYVGQLGEQMASILFQRPELVEQINKDLERFKMEYQLKVRKLQYEDQSPSNVFSLRLIDKPLDDKDEEAKVEVSLRDVGFGISQVLPIVVQSRISEKKTLLIEQPEIHLHPAHQAELGDLFIRSAKERGNTLLLETHSENLILRILRRIRETTENGKPSDEVPPIRPEDVAVLYVQPGENGAQVIEIPVTEDGDFAEKWPRGFFAERVKELF